MQDIFKDRQPTLTSSGSRCHAVAPNDNEDLPFTARFLDVLTEGDVTFTTTGGDTETYPAFKGRINYLITKVHATGTTSTSIFAGA